MDVKLPVSPETLKAVTHLDHFRGSWAHGSGIPAERLSRLREASRIQSVAASCRLAGIRVTDVEVAAVLHGDSVPLKEGPAILGYAEAMAAPFPASGARVTPLEIQGLHARAIGAHGEPPPPTPWRTEPYHLEIFDPQGRAVGQVLQTLPPRLIEEKMAAVVTWLEDALQTERDHPILVIGTFALHFVAACPFSCGNGRMVHLLLQRLLIRAGYDFIPYSSLERILEETREEYFNAMDAAETRLWTGEANLEPWLAFYLRTLEKHRERVQAKMELERRALDFSPLQRTILETIREHGTAGAGLLIEATGANRNTLKDNLRRMVDRGVLERFGERRGARYRLATGDGPLPAELPES